MSKIKELQDQLDTEDNDLKALGIAKKLSREVKNEKFTTKWLPLIQEKVKVQIDEKMDKYTMTLMNHGVIDYFPKSNRLLVRSKNQWYNRGLGFLINELKLLS